MIATANREGLLWRLWCAVLLVLGIAACEGSGWWIWHRSACNALRTDPQERLGVMRGPDGLLLKTVQTDQAVNEVLARLLSETPAAVQARVSIVHNGTVSLAGMHLLHFSTIAALAAPGSEASPMLQNQPLSQWKDFLGALIDKPHCVLKSVGDLTDREWIERMRGRGTETLIACGIFSPRGQFLGSLFTNFARLTDLPTDRRAILERHQRAAAAIGAALLLSHE